MLHELKVRPDTIQWGHIGGGAAPVLEIASGDSVRVETIDAFAGAFPDGLLDEASELVYKRVADRGPGPHIVTGPIAVHGAKPGDSLEVQIVALEPRHPFGICALSPIGTLASQFGAAIWAIVWKVDEVEHVCRPFFEFRYPSPRPSPEAVLRVDRQSVDGDIRVPIRMHLGFAAVAPAVPSRVGTMTPGEFGGNLDQWRFGIGATLTLPVLTDGALFSCGDGHLAQGDGEVCGNGIESPLTATLHFRVLHGRAYPRPILRTGTHLLIHGFGESADGACADAVEAAIALLSSEFGLPRRRAYMLTSLAGDVGITQLVDGQVGAHVCFANECLPFVPPGGDGT